jgi:hypothetical protein
MKNYFEGCKSLDEAKSLYRKLAMQLHPNVSGYDSTEDFKRMQNEFEAFRPEAEKFQGEFEQWNPGVFMAVLDQLRLLDGLDIEICGAFIWGGGDTGRHKDALKAIRPEAYFRPAFWRRKKQLWYFSPLGYRKRSAKALDMDEIRQVFGSRRFSGSEDDERPVGNRLKAA